MAALRSRRYSANICMSESLRSLIWDRKLMTPMTITKTKLLSWSLPCSKNLETWEFSFAALVAVFALPPIR